MTDARKVLITGGTGSFGRAMIEHLLGLDTVESIRVFSRDETKQWDLREQLRDPRVSYVLGDVRDRESMRRAMYGIDQVFHAAALKQVPSTEFHPLEAIRTNVVGSENVLRTALEARVRSVVMLSTDKAVYPVNAMGMSKALMEKLVWSFAREDTGSETTASVVRYGNVLCTRGSVVPLFIRQLRAGLPLTITDPQMTRFLMSMGESIELAGHALEHAGQGDLFIRKAEACTMADLAGAVLDLFRSDVGIRVIGTRHGEKLSESLATRGELSRAVDEDRYLRIPLDVRGLDYASFVDEGSSGSLLSWEDYDSASVRRLDRREVLDRLAGLPEIQRVLQGGAV